MKIKGSRIESRTKNEIPKEKKKLRIRRLHKQKKKVKQKGETVQMS